MSRGRRVLRATVEGLDGAGAVHQRPVAASGHGDADVGQGGRIVGDGVDVGDGVERVHGDMAEEIPHRLDGLVPALLQPRRLARGEGGGTADAGAFRRAVDVGGRISVRGVGERASDDLDGEVLSGRDVRGGRGGWSIQSVNCEPRTQDEQVNGGELPGGALQGRFRLTRKLCHKDRQAGGSGNGSHLG